MASDGPDAGRGPLRVVLGSDAAGLEPNATLVASLLRHTAGAVEVRIFSRDLDERAFVSGRLTLEVIRTPEELRFTGPTQAHVSSAGAFDRMAALKYCSDWDRAVMFDYDQVVVGDPMELFELEFGGALAAVRLWPGVTLGHACREWVGEALSGRWRECEDYRYFHMAPVLNLAGMRAAGTFERFAAFHRDCRMEEQVALCAACADRVVGFDPQLNWFPTWGPITDQTKVVHFYGAGKPWNDERLYGAPLWRAYETTWEELTCGQWRTQPAAGSAATDDEELGRFIRSRRRAGAALRVVELGGWDFSRMRGLARRWMQTAGDRWTVMFRPHVDRGALEEGIARFGAGLDGPGGSTEVMDGEPAEMLAWMLGQADGWESLDAVVLHAPRQPDAFLTELALVWKLLRPGGLLVVQPVARAPGNVGWCRFQATLDAWLLVIGDRSVTSMGPGGNARPGVPVTVWKNGGEPAPASLAQASADGSNSEEDIAPTPVMTVEVVHALWRDRVLLFGDGSFRRASVADGGTFERQGDEVLLRWTDFPMERVVPIGEAAADDGMADSGVVRYCLESLRECWPNTENVPETTAGKRFHCRSPGYVGPLWLGDGGRYARGRRVAGEWEELPDGAVALEPLGKPRLRLARNGSGYVGQDWRLYRVAAEFFGLWEEFDPTLPVFADLAALPLRVTSTWGNSPIPFGERWDLVLSGENAEVAPVADGLRWSFGDRSGTARWYVGTPRVDHPHAFHLPHFYDTLARLGELRPQVRKPVSGLTMVATNTGGGRRLRVAQALARWFPLAVSSGLRDHFHGLPKVTVWDVPRTPLGKLDFLSHATFNLCFENSIADGYLTEKPVDALLAGAVPVYEGDPGVGDWLDPRGMVNCGGLSAAEIADRIREAERAGVPEWVHEQREKLLRAGLPEMVGRLREFLARVREGEVISGQ